MHSRFDILHLQVIICYICYNQIYSIQILEVCNMPSLIQRISNNAHLIKGQEDMIFSKSHSEQIMSCLAVSLPIIRACFGQVNTITCLSLFSE